MILYAILYYFVLSLYYVVGDQLNEFTGGGGGQQMLRRKVR